MTVTPSPVRVPTQRPFTTDVYRMINVIMNWIRELCTNPLIFTLGMKKQDLGWETIWRLCEQSLPQMGSYLQITSVGAHSTSLRRNNEGVTRVLTESLILRMRTVLIWDFVRNYLFLLTYISLVQRSNTCNYVKVSLNYRKLPLFKKKIFSEVLRWAAF